MPENRPRPGLVSWSSSEVGQTRTPGPRRLCRFDRLALASAAAKHAMPRHRLWLWLSPRRHVSAARPALGTLWAARAGGLAGRVAASETARARRDLPDHPLPVVAARCVAVLPHPRQDLEGQRSTRNRRVRAALRPDPGPGLRDNPARPAGRAAEAGAAVRAAAASRRTARRHHTRDRHAHRAVARRSERDVAARP
jgi:hypothetical protein